MGRVKDKYEKHGSGHRRAMPLSGVSDERYVRVNLPSATTCREVQRHLVLDVLLATLYAAKTEGTLAHTLWVEMRDDVEPAFESIFRDRYNRATVRRSEQMMHDLGVARRFRSEYGLLDVNTADDRDDEVSL